MFFSKYNSLPCLALLIWSFSDYDLERIGFTNVVTVGAIEVGSNAAFLLGDIEGLRNAGITESGFILSSNVSGDSELRLDLPGNLSFTSPDRDTIKEDRAFAARAVGLNASTTYSFRAYIKVEGEEQEVYGNIEQFTTTDLSIFIKSVKRSTNYCTTTAVIEVIVNGFAEGGGTDLGLIWVEDIFTY